MSITTESSLLVRHFAIIHRLAPLERLGVLPEEGLARSRRFQVPPVLPWPGTTALLPVTVRLQCKDTIHQPGALPSLHPEREKGAHQGHGLHKRVCGKQQCVGKFAAAASNARWWRPTHSISPTRTCSKSEASKQGRPISCAATRKLRTFSKYWNADSAAPSGCSKESAAVFTTTCK
jgi:hypothetical protein